MFIAVELRRQSASDISKRLQRAQLHSSVSPNQVPPVQKAYQSKASAHEIALWSTIEPGLGITAGSLATLRKLFERVRRLATSIRNSSAASRSPHSTQAGSSRKSKGESNITRTYSNNSILKFDSRRPSQSSGQPNKGKDIEMEALTEEPESHRPSFQQSEPQSEPTE